MALFGTAGIRGSARDHVTPELALAVGRAAGVEARGATETGGDDSTELAGRPEFVIARDGRETGPALAAAAEAGLASAGIRVLRAGRLPTPALAYASQGRRGLMVTASHNPPADNGIKLFADGVEYDAEAESRIGDRLDAEPPPAAWDDWTGSERIAVLDDYLAAVADYAQDFGAPLDGLRVAVDCGNGMSAPATPRILDDLGGEVVALNGSVDGHFPGRGSKPTPASLAEFRAFLADAGDGGDAEAFAFGVAHDGDADRIVILDEDGEVVHEDTVLAILAERYVRRAAGANEGSDSDAGADPVVVTTPNASGRIDERVAAAGGRTERVRLGALHEGVAAVRADDGAVAFAAEPWKHLHPDFGGWIDGVCSAAVLARLVANDGLASLREPVTELPYRKVNIDCPDGTKAAAMAQLRDTLPDAFPEAGVDTEHGVRLEFDDAAWLLVRPSGTEPYLRLYAESASVDDLVGAAQPIVEAAVEQAN